MLLFFMYGGRMEKVSNTTATNSKYGIFPIHFAITTVVAKYAKLLRLDYSQYLAGRF